MAVKNLNRIKSEIKKSVGVSVKIQNNIVCAKNIIFGMLHYMAAEMVNMHEVSLVIK